MIRINLRRLGCTDLMLSPIGVGCWQFSKGKGMTGRYWSVLSDEEIADIVDSSLKGGINWFDTAEAYGNGESERALSSALRTLHVDKDDVIIATKWWPLLRTARSITRTIDQRLECLGVSCIDLYQVHNPYSFSSTRTEMRAMAELVEGGKIRYIGVSNYSAKAMREAHDELQKHGMVLASNQVEFSLLKRSMETNGVLETAQELGIAIIAYSPLAQGLLTGKFHTHPELARDMQLFRRIYSKFNKDLLEESQPVVDVLNELAEVHQATAAQVALSWVINVHGDTVVAIPGASKTEQASQNVGAMNFTLSAGEIQRLNDSSLMYSRKR